MAGNCSLIDRIQTCPIFLWTKYLKKLEAHLNMRIIKSISLYTNVVILAGKRLSGIRRREAVIVFLAWVRFRMLHAVTMASCICRSALKAKNNKQDIFYRY